MEQQDQTHRKALNIHLKKDGELNLSGLTLENLTTEEFLVVQQIIDESRVRSQSNRPIRKLVSQYLQGFETSPCRFCFNEEIRV